MITPNCRRCPLTQKLTSFLLNVPRSSTLCPLVETQVDFFDKLDYTRVIWYFYPFI
ncbi:hypothetical protein Hanom_Chr07g00666141 [Helianthus anomalus]